MILDEVITSAVFNIASRMKSPIEQLERWGWAPEQIFSLCADHGRTDLVQEFLKGSRRPANMATAIRFAAEGGHVETLKVLLDASGQPDSQDDLPLFSAIRGRQQNTLKLLIDRGVAVTPGVFRAACLTNDQTLLDVLLSSPQPNLQQVIDRTLSFAKAVDDAAVVKALGQKTAPSANGRSSKQPAP